MKYLLDTNVVSEMNKPQPNAAVIRWLGAISSEEIAISVITLGEIKRGIWADPSEKRRATLQNWYKNTFLKVYSGNIIDITPAVMDEWAIRFQAAKSVGKTPSSMDSLIAATAAAHGLFVVTRNEDDFTPMQVKVLNIWE